MVIIAAPKRRRSNMMKQEDPEGEMSQSSSL